MPTKAVQNQPMLCPTLLKSYAFFQCFLSLWTLYIEKSNVILTSNHSFILHTTYASKSFPSLFLSITWIYFLLSISITSTCLDHPNLTTHIYYNNWPITESLNRLWASTDCFPPCRWSNLFKMQIWAWHFPHPQHRWAWNSSMAFHCSWIMTKIFNLIYKVLKWSDF